MSGITDAIQRGDFDHELPSFIAAVEARQRVLGHKAFHTLNIGDKVVFNDKANPKYLQGVEAIITGKKKTRVTVEFAESVGRFHAGVEITSPISIFDLVESRDTDALAEAGIQVKETLKEFGE